MPTRHFAINGLILVAALSWGGAALAVVKPDVANTKHNLSSSGPGPVKAVSESQICVFCHTPHQATLEPKAPLWNRKLSGATYSPYTSNSMEATGLGQPGGSSKLCLSCHDGTLALGAVNVLNGKPNVTINLSGTAADGTMPPGQGVDTGFTRDLGTDLGNDHPISFTYNSALATADGELRDPATTSYIANRVPGIKPLVPLEDNQVQCISCHDPHIRDTSGTDIKFLRLNRFQKAAPVGGAFDQANDIICLACHDKAGWSGSAHANTVVANEQYTNAAATLRDFPSNLQVWQAGCLNCHDPHTVQGARRLLREGTNSTATPKNGGSSAIEETCYQCHNGVTAVLTNVSSVPDIKTDFTTTTRYMPIADTPEVHDIGTGTGTQRGKDFIESQTLLDNRHVECTDCHNPHRVIKNRLFNANPASPDPGGTHTHDYGHTNLASGVLRGSWGVEPNYGSTAWGALPSSYDIKRGDGGIGANTARTAGYVTREYQICLKCHSDYAYGLTPPNLGDPGNPGGTPSGTNGMTQYTNQAMEFQPPTAAKGEPGGNHRSWHPVIDNTGRTASVRGSMNASNFLAPWNDTSGTNVGNQTMYCSDCHGSNTATGTVVPNSGKPWGPHGSNNNFLLKGNWSQSTGSTGTTSDLCFKCHDYDQYANPNPSTIKKSGFSGSGGGGGMGGMGGGGGGGMCGVNTTNMHVGHAARLGKPLKCTWCHVAVPHGWKNKALLVNVYDEGVSITSNSQTYTNGPYYLNAKLGGNSGGINWKSSGNWTAGDCGGSMMGWMTQACNNPP